MFAVSFILLTGIVICQSAIAIWVALKVVAYWRLVSKKDKVGGVCLCLFCVFSAVVLAERALHFYNSHPTPQPPYLLAKPEDTP